MGNRRKNQSPSGETAPKKTRNPHFSENESKVLLNIWCQPEKQNRFKSFSRHASLWDSIASELYQHGIDKDGDPNFPRRSGSNVKDRIANLKKTYTVHKSKQSSGVAAPSLNEFPYWDDFEKVLGTRDCMTNVHAVDSMDDSPVCRDDGENENENDNDMAGIDVSPIPSPNQDNLPEEENLNESVPSTPSRKSESRKKRKKEDESETLLSQLLEVQKSSLEINQRRLQQEEALTLAMTNFFNSGSQYFNVKTACSQATNPHAPDPPTHTIVISTNVLNEEEKED